MEIDEEFEEEDILIYVDVDTYVTEKEIQDDSQIKILGIDEKKPILQINNRIFEGEYKQPVGTLVFFQEDHENKPDPVFSKSKVFYKYFDKTNKVLKMTRITINERQELNELQEEDTIEENELQEYNKYQVKKTYQEALNMFLPPGSRAPREIPEPENGRNLTLEGNVTKATISKISSQSDAEMCLDIDDINDKDYDPSVNS